MTNQNGLVKSHVNNTLMELAMSISNSGLLPRGAVPELMALLGGLLGRPKKRLMKPSLEDGVENGTTKVNAWIDSMRASSPPRVKSYSNIDQSPWTVSIFS